MLFSGDVGRFETVLAHDPELAPSADYLVVESTYGNRTHAAVPVLDQLQAVLSAPSRAAACCSSPRSRWAARSR